MAIFNIPIVNLLFQKFYYLNIFVFLCTRKVVRQRVGAVASEWPFIVCFQQRTCFEWKFNVFLLYKRNFNRYGLFLIGFFYPFQSILIQPSLFAVLKIYNYNYVKSQAWHSSVYITHIKGIYTIINFSNKHICQQQKNHQYY